MTIAIIAHDGKKAEMAQFLHQHKNCYTLRALI